MSDPRDLLVLINSFPTLLSSAVGWRGGPVAVDLPVRAPSHRQRRRGARRVPGHRHPGALHGGVPDARHRDAAARVRTRPDPRLGARMPVYLTRSEEHTSEHQSLMRISYAVF